MNDNEFSSIEFTQINTHNNYSDNELDCMNSELLELIEGNNISIFDYEQIKRYIAEVLENHYQKQRK
jgi:hypothetical protein